MHVKGTKLIFVSYQLMLLLYIKGAQCLFDVFVYIVHLGTTIYVLNKNVHLFNTF